MGTPACSCTPLPSGHSLGFHSLCHLGIGHLAVIGHHLVIGRSRTGGNGQASTSYLTGSAIQHLLGTYCMLCCDGNTDFLLLIRFVFRESGVGVGMIRAVIVTVFCLGWGSTL